MTDKQENAMTYLAWIGDEINFMLQERDGLKTQVQRLNEELSMFRNSDKMDNGKLVQRNRELENQLVATQKLLNGMKRNYDTVVESMKKEHEVHVNQLVANLEKKHSDEVFKMKQDIERLQKQCNIQPLMSPPINIPFRPQYTS
jgi:hypothetical protein